MSLDLISYCFLKLALHREFHGQWRTGDQWVQILISKYKDCLTTILQQPDTFNSRMLDNALHKNKVIKANLGNYLTGTNATGIMSRSYRPQSTESSNESRIRVNCYCITAPFLPEPPLPTGVHFWYETIPTTTLRTSIRTMKRPRSGGTEISEEEQQQVGDTTNQPNQATMDIDVQHQLEPFVFDPFEDPRARKLFLPSEASEHPRSAIARRIDLLREVLSEPEGHKKIILGGDPYNNCTEQDKIRLQEKAIYLINSLHIALKCYPGKTWRQCCQEAAEVSSLFANKYTGKTVEDWWIAFRQKDGFLHPRGIEGSSQNYKSRLPRIFRENEDLHSKFVKWAMQNLGDLTVERARQYLVDVIYPLAVPVDQGTLEEQKKERTEILSRLYKIGPSPCHYILAYFYMEHDEENKIDEEGLHELNIERVKKEFKTHRSAIDFDEKFITYCFRRREDPARAAESNNNNRINIYNSNKN